MTKKCIFKTIKSLTIYSKKVFAYFSPVFSEKLIYFFCLVLKENVQLLIIILIITPLVALKLVPLIKQNHSHSLNILSNPI